NRIEDKLLLSNDDAEFLARETEGRMKPSYLHPETKFTLIASWYLDGPELNFFQHHFQKAPKRYKLRIRRYAPDGIWNDAAPLLELKSKEDGISKKKRFNLTGEAYEDLMKGRTVTMTAGLQAVNQKIAPEKLARRVKKINSLISEFALRPVLKVTYKRYAYEADDFRLTMDRNLEIEDLGFDVPAVVKKRLSASEIWPEAQRLGAKYDRSRHCVVELKHHGTLPAWVEAFIYARKLQKASFSKYCWCIHEVSGCAEKAAERGVIAGRRPMFAPAYAK
ncbi:MAG: VTC domain-containing protein, partial [Elusimicrobiota bacterium]